ncbi:MAG: hypothetical protein JNG85_01955, partial [Spirochaetaceae bacterium]|nr:hypothetical protein [Spirochaetaceae bacterium]
GLWLRSSTFSSDTNLTATISGGSSETQAIVAAPSATDSDLSAIASGGLELRLGPVVLHGSLGLGLDAPLLQLAPLSLNGVTVRTGVRFAY